MEFALFAYDVKEQVRHNALLEFCLARIIASPLDCWRQCKYSPEGTPRNSSWTTCIWFVLKTSIIWEEPINKFINSSRGIPANSCYEYLFTIKNELANNWKFVTTVWKTFVLARELLYRIWNINTGSEILIPDPKLPGSPYHPKNLFIFICYVSTLYLLNFVWQTQLGNGSIWLIDFTN